MLKKVFTCIFILVGIMLGISYVEATTYEWNIGGLKQMDYDSINAEEIEVELTFYCGVNNAMEGGPKSAAGKYLVYGNLANNYYTGIKSVSGGQSWTQLNNGYSLGTNVYIKDVGLFSIEDRGGSSEFNTTNRMDLFVSRREGESDSEWEKRTNSYGRVKVKAKIVKDGTERIWEWPSGNSAASPSSSVTSSNNVSGTNTGINTKIIYNNIKTVTTAGSKPVTYTTNCKDAVAAYWNKTTILSGEGAVGTDENNINTENVIINTGDEEIDALLKAAISQIGYVEGSGNNTKFGEWYKLNYQPWCAMFVSWCANEAGLLNTVIPKYASCLQGLKWYNGQGRLYLSSGNYEPKAGDIFIQTSSGTHTGIVVAYKDGYIYTVEGNYSNKVSYVKRAKTSVYAFGSNGGSSSGIVPDKYDTGGGTTR